MNPSYLKFKWTRSINFLGELKVKTSLSNENLIDIIIIFHKRKGEKPSRSIKCFPERRQSMAASSVESLSPLSIQNCRLSSLEFVGPITKLAHLFLPVCHHLIGRQYVTRSVIGWKLFTLQYVEALPSVCTELWLPTQWVHRPKQCPTPLSYWIPREQRAWLSSQCWLWHGWRDSLQDFLLSSDSRASSTSSIHGRIW